MIFFIDTAFDVTTIAIKKEEKFYKEIIDTDTNISQVLIDRTRAILDKSKSKKKDIKLIIFNQGPGNFTSLRISLSYIKAIAFHLNIPVITLNSFQILALSANKNENEYPIIIVIDARMNEVYYAEYKSISDVFSKDNSCCLISYEKFYKKIENIKKEKINIIKNSSNFLLDANQCNSSVIETIINSQDINIPNIFKSIDENLYQREVNIDDVSLLYVRDNVAKKNKSKENINE